MPKPNGLTKRPGSTNWYYRKRWPKHLRGPGDPNDVWITLNTSEYSVALTRLDAARLAAAERFRSLRVPESSGIRVSFPSPLRPMDRDLAVLSVEAAAPLATAYFHEQLVAMDANPTLEADFSPRQFRSYRNEVEDRLAVLRTPRDDEEHPSLRIEIALLRLHGLRSEYGSEASGLLREYLRRAMIQLSRIELGRLVGDFSVAADDELFSRPAGAPYVQPVLRDAPAVRVTVANAAADYSVEKIASVANAKTRNRYTRELAHIVSLLGPDTPVRDVRRAECRKLREAFGALRPNFAQFLKEGETLTDLIGHRAANAPTLSHATQKKYLSALDRFLAWALKEDLVDQNYGEKLPPLAEKSDGTMAKLPFKEEELERVFRRPIYMGCTNDEAGFSRAGPNIIRRSRYWAPLISLFAGLRSGEILQLTPSHFRRSPEGNPFIVLTPDMKLKSENAQREIPVHQALIDIGLLTWIVRRRDQSASLLFPEVVPDKYGAASATFSKRFRSDLKHFDLGARRKKLTFHSFRHTFKQALERGNSPEHDMEELCGWARGTRVSRRYGTGLEADRLKGCIDAIRYDLDLGHLSHHSDLRD